MFRPVSVLSFGKRLKTIDYGGIDGGYAGSVEGNAETEPAGNAGRG
jgi:hypothetical protein